MSENLKELVSEEIRFEGKKINRYEVTHAVSRAIRDVVSNRLNVNADDVPVGLLTVRIAYAAPQYNEELTMIKRSSDGFCQLIDKGLPTTLWVPEGAIEAVVNANYPKVKMMRTVYDRTQGEVSYYDIETVPR